jgi:Uma2 family endonuclease
MSTINFAKYDEDNPQIWEQFLRVAREAKRRGFVKYSAKGIFEIIRWETGAHGNDQFKLNNNYHADYARKIMDLLPDEFGGFFRLRETRAERS